MKEKTTNMKSPANQSKRLLTKSSTDKKLSPKQPSKVKKSKTKKVVDPLKSIKEKLAGKIYSPTVEKAKMKLKKNSSLSTDSHNKKKPVKKTLPQITATTISKPDNKKNKLPVVKKQTAKNLKTETKGNNPLTLKVNIKKKINSPKVDNSTSLKINQVQANVRSRKRKLKAGNSELPVVQPKKAKKKVKVEEEHIPTLVDINGVNQPLAKKPRQSKIKRKSSVTSVKDLKPISNIRSLVKKPRRFSKVQLKNQNSSEKGVCYFSHIPHGFYEKELKQYCSQFGKVTGVYHPVSKQGNSKGYAFVEFLHKEVAEVVADTMNNYLMFNRLVKCEYVPPEHQRPWVFKRNWNNHKAACSRRMENLKCQMRKLSEDEVKKWKKRRLAKVASMHKKLASLGLDYEFQVNDTNIIETKKEENNETLNLGFSM